MIKEVILDQICEDIVPGFACRPNEGQKGVLQLRPYSISLDGRIDLSQSKYVKCSEQALKKYRLLEGDVLFNNTNSPELVGKTALFKNNIECVFSNHMTRVRIKKDIADPGYIARYLHGLFQRRVFFNRCQQWVNQAAIQKTELSKLKIPLPSIENQRQIANIIIRAESILEKRRQTIRLSDQFLKSAFLEMFGDPTKKYKFYKNQLGNYINVIGGFAFKSSEFVKEGIPVIKIGTVNKGYFDLSSFSFISAEYKKKYPKYIVRPFDLLISLTGTTGKDDYANICIASDHYEFYFLNQRVAKLVVDERNLNRIFLYYYLKHPFIKQTLTTVSRGVRQANISNEDIMSIKIDLPPKILQQKFADLVQKVEKLKEKQKQSETQLQNLFNSLMQRAFNGKLHVK